MRERLLSLARVEGIEPPLFLERQQPNRGTLPMLAAQACLSSGSRMSFDAAIFGAASTENSRPESAEMVGVSHWRDGFSGG